MTKQPRVYSGERTVSSINGAGKTEQLPTKETGPQSYTTQKNFLRIIEKVYADKTMGVYIYFELVLSFSLSRYPGV